MRPTARVWDKEIMPGGNPVGIFNTDISEQSGLDNSSTDSSSDSSSGSDDDSDDRPKKQKSKSLDNWVGPSIEHKDLVSMDDDSPSRQEWLRQKREENEQNEFLDAIMSLVGQESFKAHCLWVNDRWKIAKRWEEDTKSIKLDLMLRGQDETGAIPFLYPT